MRSIGRAAAVILVTVTWGGSQALTDGGSGRVTHREEKAGVFLCNLELSSRTIVPGDPIHNS